MKVFGRSLAIAALLSACLGSAAAVRADTEQEVFICKLNEGKTMADLNKVIADFKQMIGKIKGGDAYQAWLLRPVASDDMTQIVWVGEMPDAASLAALQADYLSTEAGQAQHKKFQSVITFKSRTIWSSAKIK